MPRKTRARNASVASRTLRGPASPAFEVKNVKGDNRQASSSFYVNGERIPSQQEREQIFETESPYLIQSFYAQPSAGAAIDLANLFLSAGRIEQACSYFKKAIDLDSASELIVFNTAIDCAGKFHNIDALKIIDVLIEYGGKNLKKYTARKTLLEQAIRNTKTASIDDLISAGIVLVSKNQFSNITKMHIAKATKSDEIIIAAQEIVSRYCQNVSKEAADNAAAFVGLIVDLTASNNEIHVKRAFDVLKKELARTPSYQEDAKPMMRAEDRATFLASSEANPWTVESGAPSAHIVEHFEPWFERGLTIEDIERAQPELAAEYKNEIVRNTRKRIKALTKPHKLPSDAPWRPSPSIRRVAELSPDELTLRRTQQNARKARSRAKGTKPS